MNSHGSKIIPLLAFLIAAGLALVAAHALSYGALLDHEHEADTDLIGRLFGEGRQILGEEMIEKADRYFHGGVGHRHIGECHALEHAAAEDEEKHGDEHEHDESPSPESPTGHEHGQHAQQHPWWQPWGRLNTALHPHGHRHLHGKRQEKEVLPWVWAAVQADPHNIRAWLTTAYWLANRLDKPVQAVDLLDHGIRRNPDAYPLLAAKARILSRRLGDFENALELLETAATSWAEQHPEGPEEAPREAKLDYLNILTQIGWIHKKSGNTREAIRAFRRVLPHSPSQTGLRRHINDLQKSSTSAVPSENNGATP